MTQPTNGEVRKALKGSIAKWTAIAAGVMKDGGSSDCALCTMFRKTHHGPLTCYGCPIKEHTGQHNCNKSPYCTWLNTAQTPEDAKPMVKFLKSPDRKFFTKEK